MSFHPTPHPTYEERQRWAEFVAEAVDFASRMRGVAGGAPMPKADRLTRARKRVRRCVLPENQQHVGSPLMLLLATVDAFALYTEQERIGEQGTLAVLAAKAAQAIANKGRGA